VCVERAGDMPLAPAEVESLRLACDLCTVRLLDLRRRDRWIGAKAAAGVRACLAAMVGPKHTWAKVTAMLLIAAGIYIGVASGDYRVDAPFTFEAATKQIVPAPFDGEVDSVEVRLGDNVRAGAVLATLKTLPLQRKIDQARAGLYEHLKQADAARSDKKWADAQMAAAQARQFQEQIALLTEQIEQAAVKARIDGSVIRGGLDRFVGSSVEKGQVLFEIAPLDNLRAELLIPEDQVADLQAAMRAGEVRAVLSAGAYPDKPIEAVMERILPLAEKIDGKVVFRARARLSAEPQAVEAGRESILPGMEGAAHVSLGRRSLAWIWSRRAVNKLRLWMWL
jgi:multidrug efflux pump subunit AcrA (membrane-fusion protein)